MSALLVVMFNLLHKLSRESRHWLVLSKNAKASVFDENTMCNEY
jgi:hypothetical protein